MTIYLDAAATTPVYPAVIDVMAEVLAVPSNASSQHTFGRDARRRVEQAREMVAASVSARPRDILFTGGGTESNNHALKAWPDLPVAVSAIEHDATLKARSDALILPVLPSGIVDVAAIPAFLRQASFVQGESRPHGLLSVMAVNNETGVIQPVEAVAQIARDHGWLFHCDASQALGKIDLNAGELGADLITLCAHKTGGPQAVGALVLKPGLDLPKFLHGGGQERSRRAGTENVAGIAGFAKACELIVDAAPDPDRLSWQRRLEDRLKAAGAVINGAEADRIATLSNIRMPGVPAATQLMNFDMAGIAVSSGSACSSGTVKVSHVLRAMGQSDGEAGSAVRVSWSHANTRDDLDRFADAWIATAERLM